VSVCGQSAARSRRDIPRYITLEKGDLKRKSEIPREGEKESSQAGAGKRNKIFETNRKKETRNGRERDPERN